MGLLEPYKPPLARRSRAITPQVRKCHPQAPDSFASKAALCGTFLLGVGWAFNSFVNTMEHEGHSFDRVTFAFRERVSFAALVTPFFFAGN